MAEKSPFIIPDEDLDTRISRIMREGQIRAAACETSPLPKPLAPGVQLGDVVTEEEPEERLTLHQTSRLLNVSYATIYKWRHLGLLVAYKPSSRKVYFKKHEVLTAKLPAGHRRPAPQATNG